MGFTIVQYHTLRFNQFSHFGKFVLFFLDNFKFTNNNISGQISENNFVHIGFWALLTDRLGRICAEISGHFFQSGAASSRISSRFSSI